MRHLLQTVVVGLGIAVAAPAFAAAPAPAPAPAAKPQLKDEKAFLTHLKEHNKWPATKAELMKACENLKDVNADDKKWFTDKLPEGSYKSADDVLKAVGLK